MPIFAQAFLGAENSGSSNYKLCFDVQKEFLPLSHAQDYFRSQKDMIIQMTTFQYEAMFMTEGEQTKYINYLTRPKDQLNYFGRSLFGVLRYCPECLCEDRKTYGEGFFHREHHLAGVCMCPKHHVSLLKYNSKKGNEFSFGAEDYVPYNTDYEGNENSLNAFADYTYALYEAKLETNINIIKQIIFQHLHENGHYARNNYEELRKIFNCWEHNALMHMGFVSFMKQRLPSIINVDPSAITVLLMFLFPDPRVLINKIRESSKGYVLLEEYTCDSCGTVYCATPKAQHDGWGCPLCASRLSIEERYRTILANTTGGDYEPLERFEVLDKRMVHKHLACGRERPLLPRNLLFGNPTCECERIVSGSKAKRAVEKNDGFLLMEFHGTKEPVTIRHTKCGELFETEYYLFLRHPYCKKCVAEDGFEASRKMLVDRIADLTGDEYTLLSFSGWLEKVEIRHNKCGKSHFYLPDNFSKGSRCPHCRKVLKNEQIKALLEKASDGAYTITEFGRSHCMVLNTETGREIQTTTPRVKQELFRPTPSDFLPLIQKSYGSAEKTTAWDIAFELYKEHKAECGDTPPKGGLYKGFDLGLWCQHQRDDYRKDKLPQERIDLLNEVSFDWDPLLSSWNKSFELYRKYIAEKGTAKIPVSEEYDGVKLGLWMWRQKKRYRNGTLLKEREEALKSLDENIFDLKCKSGKPQKAKEGDSIQKTRAEDQQ